MFHIMWKYYYYTSNQRFYEVYIRFVYNLEELEVSVNTRIEFA